MEDIVEIKGSPDHGDTDGKVNKWEYTATFEDGTELTVIARVPRMPLSDMTPIDVTSIIFGRVPDLEGGDDYFDFKEVVTASDNGATELHKLEQQTSAYKMLVKIYLELEARQKKEDD